MSDPFAKMTPGQPLRSGIGPFNLEWHNAVSDLVRHSIRHKSAGLNQGNIEVLEDTKIWIANVEGVIIPQFTAIGINKLLTFPDDFSDFRNRMCFVTAPLVRNRPFAITQKSIHVNQVFIAKSAIAAGDVQPPAGAWSRLIGDADPFDATAHYAIGEQVTYGGETYAAILPVDGQATSDTTYWIPLGSRRGLWDGASYAAGEIVAVPSLGEILISGISRLLLFISHPKHLYAGVSELGISTQEEPGPLEIIWKEDGTGERWAIVRFCCDAFGLQVCAGVGALVFGPLELSASGIRYGGDFTAGVATLAGSGTSTPPGYTGDGAGSLPALTLTGSGNVYDPTPSGNLYFGVTALAGTGTVVNPPSGFAFIQFGALALDGTGTNTSPTFTGDGAVVDSADVLSVATSYTGVELFVAEMTAPIQQVSSGRWIYAWIEQTISPASGDYVDMPEGRSGDTISGPFMRERNDTLTCTPVYSLVRQRGNFGGQRLYDFEHCCTTGSVIGTGSLIDTVDTVEGVGEVTPTGSIGGGSVIDTADTCDGVATVDPVGFVGYGPLIDTVDLADGVATITPTGFVGAGALIDTVDTCAGVGYLYSNSDFTSEGGIAIGGVYQTMADIPVQGGIAIGGTI